MPVIDSEGFFGRVVPKAESVIRITGIQNGRFILMADYRGQTYIHAKPDGQPVHYDDIEDIFRLLQVETYKTDLVVTIRNWVSR